MLGKGIQLNASPADGEFPDPVDLRVSVVPVHIHGLEVTIGEENPDLVSLPHHLQATGIDHSGAAGTPGARVGKEYSYNTASIALTVFASYPSVLAKPFLSVLPQAVLPRK